MVQLNIDVDSRADTGFCTGTAGVFPSLCGVDMTVRVISSVNEVDWGVGFV